MKRTIDFSTLLIAVGLLHSTVFSLPGRSQIVPDDTLGAESSIVNSIDPLVDRIDGGAIRGENLFHSFQEFNVGEGRTVNFSNPAVVENILTRVTGDNASNIFGTLGTLGNANFFLINPNGIVFGPNAQLNVGGSFVASTANSIDFFNGTQFSATNPEAPPLLTIDVPLGLQYGSNPEGIDVRGSQLEVPNRETLALIGGNTNIDGGRLVAQSGRIELGGLASSGLVEIVPQSDAIQFRFPETGLRGDVLLTNETNVLTLSDGGGSIAINARNVELQNSNIFTGIPLGEGFPGAQAGDINIVAQGEVIATDASAIGNIVQIGSIGNAGDIRIVADSLSVTSDTLVFSDTAGQGNAGNISIEAREFIVLDGTFSEISASVDEDGVGNGGNIDISTRSLFINNGSQIEARTRGRGNAGNINLSADLISLNGVGEGDSQSGVFTNVAENAEGNAGNITINARELSLTNSTRIMARTQGRGNAGNLTINATESVLLDGSVGDFSGRLDTQVEGGAEGNAGNISIETPSLLLINGAVISTANAGIGDAGNINIISDRLSILDGSFLLSSTQEIGNAGNIEVLADRVLVRNTSGIGSNSSEQGNAGNILVRANDEIILDNIAAIINILDDDGVGEGADISIETPFLSLTNSSAILSSTLGIGDGGDIEINSDRIFIENESFLGSFSIGIGNAGDVSIRANDEIVLSGLSSIDSSLADDGLGRVGVGRSGNISIETGLLSMTDRAILSSGTSGEGDGGSLLIRVTDNIFLSKSFIFNDVSGIGNGGDISIQARNIVLDNTLISANVSNLGRAGQISLQATDSIELNNLSVIGNIISETGIGQGNDISIEADSLSLSNTSSIATTTFGQGNAGNLSVRVTNNISIDGLSGITTAVLVDAVGQGGDITLEAGSLRMTDGSSLFSSTFGNGDAGNVFMRVNNGISMDGSFINSSAFLNAVGDSGNIDISARSIELTNGSSIGTLAIGTQDTPGRVGRGGNIQIRATDFVTLSGVETRPLSNIPNVPLPPSIIGGSSSGIFSTTGTGATGRGGDISIETGVLQVFDSAIINAQTQNPNDGGNIVVNADRVALTGGGRAITTTEDAGRAGNITFNISDVLTIEGSDPTFIDRLSGTGLDIPEENPISGIFANTDDISFGDGGTVRISSGEIAVRDDARVSVSSEGTGAAGNLIVDAGSIDLDTGGSLRAETTAGTQGNIDLTSNDLVLRRNSNITTNATGTATGGNITIDTGVLAALENSDISANAQESFGGRVTINTQGIFGTQFREQQTPESDITATSALGPQFSGIVEINTPDIDATAGLTELPENPDIPRLARGCQAGGVGDARFVNTGRSGVPPNPYEPLSSDALVEDTQLPTSWQEDTSEPLVEAQGWTVNDRGQVVLVGDTSASGTLNRCGVH